MTDKNGKWAQIDMDADECEAVAELAENAEALARLRNWTVAEQQRKRVIMNRVRYKMNIAASALRPGIVNVESELPPWLKGRH